MCETEDFEKPIKQPTAIVSFFVKEGEGDSTFIQRQIGFFFLSITWVYFCRLFLFFSGTINTSISTVSVCDFIKEHNDPVTTNEWISCFQI